MTKRLTIKLWNKSILILWLILNSIFNNYGVATDETSTTPSVIKETVPLNLEESSRINYQKGLEALNTNQEIEAATLFKKALIDFSRNHKARIQLVTLYQKIGWTSETEQLLIEGLDLVPDHLDFIKYLGKHYQQTGQMRKSLSILLSMPDAGSKQIDYLALLALAYLNTEQSEVAEKYYRQLLILNKNNPAWYLGLALCQESNGVYMQSIDNLIKAKNIGRFNNETLDYINNKIQQLQNY